MPPAAPVLGAHVRKSLEIAAVRPAFALGLRAATATIAPLVVGDASGQPIFGWMALGGWLCAFADPGGPHLLRARTMAAFAAAAALVTGLGTVASTSSALSIALLFAGAIAASLARVGGEAAGTVGTTALILLCIALGSPAPPDQALPRVAMALGGCALSTVLALLLWPVHAYRPARLAIASCYRELAALAARIAEPSEDRERAWSALVMQQPPRVRAELERARVALGAVRRARNAESARGQQLVVLFETADVLLRELIIVGEALAAAHTVDASWLRAVAAALQGIADAIEDRAGPPAISLPGSLPGAPPEVEHARARLITTVQLAVRVAAALRTGAPLESDVLAPETEAPRTTVRAALAPDSAVLRHAARMAVTVSIGAAIAAWLGVARASWVTVAVVIVLQPDSGSTVRRAVLRGPTLVGVVLFPLSALALALRPLNYGLFTLLVTPVFLLMAEVLSGDWHLAGARIESTLIGGGLAFAAQLLWPSRERDQLPQRLAALFHRLREYLDAVLADPRSEPAARRSFGLAAANADASFQRHLGEVAEPAERISAYMTLLTYARRLRNSIAMALHSPDGVDLRALRPALDSALEDLGAAVRDQRPPGPPPPIDDKTPAGVRLSRQLSILHSAVDRLAAHGRPETPGRRRASPADTRSTT